MSVLIRKPTKSFLITGSCGFIGNLLVRSLVKSYSSHRLCFILPVRNIKKARELFQNYLETEDIFIEFMECAIEDETLQKINFEFPLDYIIHCAAPTASSYMISHPVETVNSIVQGTLNILEVAKRMKVKSMVYLSSMEVYGAVKEIGRTRKEEELGDIDLKSARSCYSLGKRMAEHYCHIYQQEYGVAVKVARLSQVFGHGVRLDDNRVYMQFARAAYEGKDIVLKTEGKSIGNYCSSEDAVNAICIILTKGNDGEVYNVVNEANTMYIRDMAELVANEVAKGKIKVRIEIEDSKKTGYAPHTELRLSGEKLRTLGFNPTKGLIQMYLDVVDEIRSANKVTETILKTKCHYNTKCYFNRK